jgi:hypothetical protein
MVVAGGNTTVASCNTVVQGETGSDTVYDWALNPSANKDWYGCKFVATATKSICKVALYLKKSGTPTGNIIVYIYTHDAANDEPQAQVADAVSDSYAMASLTTSYQWIDFTFSTSPSITNTTTYWLVTYCDQISDTNQVLCESTKDGTTERLEYSGDGSDNSWTNESTIRTLKYQLYE